MPLTPETVLTNLESAVGRRSENDYIQSFASEDVGLEPFTFMADPQTAATYSGMFDEWSIIQERVFIQALFNDVSLPKDSVRSLEISVESAVVDETASVEAHYILDVRHTRPSVPQLLRGRLTFKLLKGNDGGWYIQFWQDSREASHHCWSDLKAQFK